MSASDRISVPDSPWPSGFQSAVSLTFDDGVASQLQHAVPLLNKYGLRGTFYINPEKDYRERFAPWKEVALAGHEIGNHTVGHPCSVNFAFTRQMCRCALEEMTLTEIETDILEAGRRIHELFPEQEATSFAYPCYESFVGRGENRQSYVPVVARHCVAGRAMGLRPNDPRFCDLSHLWSTPCEYLAAPALIGLAEQAAALGHWLILTFHGINDGHLHVAYRDLEELCQFLARQNQRIYTAPVAAVAKLVAPWQKAISGALKKGAV